MRLGRPPLPYSKNHFNSHTPCGVRPEVSKPMLTFSLFQLTHPMRGATAHQIDDTTPADDFNSHTPCGVRPTYCRNRIMYHHISTHTPHAGCDWQTNTKIGGHSYISTHTPHAGCDYRKPVKRIDRGKISTHTPHAGCDLKQSFYISPPRIISTHTPHAGCDSFFLLSYFICFRFQLTHPMRGATLKFYVTSI